MAAKRKTTTSRPKGLWDDAWPASLIVDFRDIGAAVAYIGRTGHRHAIAACVVKGSVWLHTDAASEDVYRFLDMRVP